MISVSASTRKAKKEGKKKERWKSNQCPRQASTNSFSCSGDLSVITYFLFSHVLSLWTSYKHLRIPLTFDLTWMNYIHGIAKNANFTLGFIKRDLKLAPPPVELLSYTSLVRSKLEYAATIWGPSRLTSGTSSNQYQIEQLGSFC